MSDEQHPDPQLEHRELRESATDWIEAGAAVVGATAAVGSLAWRVRTDLRQEAREQATIDALLDRGGNDGRLDLDAGYDPGFGEPPINLGVDGEDSDAPIDFGVDDYNPWR
jgi:hypothetical protein